MQRNTREFKREPLTEEEKNALEAAAQTFKEQLIIFTLLDTGLRVSELAKLTSDRIEWSYNRISLYGKGGVRRVVHLPERTKKLLDAHFSHRKDFGIPVRTIQHIVGVVGRRAGIRKRVHPHILRHTFSITAIKRGINPKVLQVILGHTRLETTNIYLNMSPEDALAEFKKKWE